jgi:hypothetical protein
VVLKKRKILIVISLAFLALILGFLCLLWGGAIVFMKDQGDINEICESRLEGSEIIGVYSKFCGDCSYVCVVAEGNDAQMQKDYAGNGFPVWENDVSNMDDSVYYYSKLLVFCRFDEAKELFPVLREYSDDDVVSFYNGYNGYTVFGTSSSYSVCWLCVEKDGIQKVIYIATPPYWVINAY